MLLEPATVRNVLRAINEINAFEREGDFKPLARRALKELLEKCLEEEMAEYLRVPPMSMPPLHFLVAPVFWPQNGACNTLLEVSDVDCRAAPQSALHGRVASRRVPRMFLSSHHDRPRLRLSPMCWRENIAD